MERILASLVEKLIGAYGDRLISVILYGSAADGSRHDRFSDLNVFCVLKSITVRELAESEPIFRWWRQLGQPSPLLMTEEETRRSTDSFPIEFQDMSEHRTVLHGRDVVAGLSVNRSLYRAQLEHDLRAQVLRLRQQATAVLSDRNALLRLCLDSLSTFSVLGRHALLISGRQCGWSRREILEAFERECGIEMTAFRKLLDIRENKVAPQEVEPATLFEKYLNQVYQIVALVDSLE
jgi:predicted nucleotidyltransferase